MQIAKLNLERNPNIGLYGLSNDKYCLLGSNFSSKEAKEVGDTLGVPVYQADVYGTSLIGVFCNGNEDILFVPEIVRKSEVTTLKALLKPVGVEVVVLKTKYNALGNNLIFHGKNCLYSPLMKDVAEEIAKKGFKVKEARFYNHISIGSCAVINNKGILLYNDADDIDVKTVEEFFKLKVEIGSVNFGSPYVRSGILANSKGVVIGSATSGPEIMRLTSALGLED